MDQESDASKGHGGFYHGVRLLAEAMGKKQSGRFERGRDLIAPRWFAKSGPNGRENKMMDTRAFNDPRRLFELWRELTGEDLLPEKTALEPKPQKMKEEQRK